MGYQAKVKKIRRYLTDAAQNGGGKGKETPPARDAAIVRRVMAKLWPRSRRGKTSHRPPHVAPAERSPFAFPGAR